MRTWFGIAGGVIIFLLTLFMIYFFSTTEGPRTELHFEDGGIVKHNDSDVPLQQQYRQKESDSPTLKEKGGIGSGWEAGVIKTNVAAEKYTKPKQSAEERTTEPETKKTAQKPIEYFNVGDSLWKSKEPNEAAPSSTKESEETTEQKNIRDYGNTVGTIIQTFVLTNAKQDERLGLFVTQRSESSRAYVEKLATNYDTLANKIDATSGLPDFNEAQKNLASGYHAIADGLRVLKKATSDEDVYPLMLTYNEHVEIFGGHFITFALLFKEKGITFKDYEPGVIFTPPVTIQ
jgi:hypothetical protein